jgi:hypothetical protein
MTFSTMTLSITIKSVATSITTLSITISGSILYAECCLFFIVMLGVVYAECRVLYCYAECRYAECRCAECRGSKLTSQFLLSTEIPHLSFEFSQIEEKPKKDFFSLSCKCRNNFCGQTAVSFVG